ncbi:MAG TPA: diacylglycerol kinase family protein, partial [Microthrixaceae bacterium]|nr:diacylglycerol kinase family protein [Microthrixaceae bacterium]
AILVVVVGVHSSWRAVVIVVVGILVSVVAGWYALGRRGVRRWIGVGVAIAGVGTLIAGFLAAEMHGLRVAVATALGVLAVASARVALRRSVRAMRRIALSRNPVPPARNPVLFINLKSGGGKAERFHLVDECRARGIEPIVLEPGDDLLQLAEKAIADGADVVGMAGGDGSQALVATAAIAHDVPHVVVPSGTRNHFALDLGLDREDVVGALDAFGDGVERRVDIAEVNGRVFVNNASAGVYAAVVQAPEYRDAKRSTVLAMLPDLIGPDATPPDLRFTGPDGTAHDTADVILVSNDPYQLHELLGRGTRQRLDHGALGIVAVRIGSAREAGRMVALEMTGRATRFQGWLEWTAADFRIDSGAPVEIGVDGEALRLEPPLSFRTRPGALRVRLPRHAIGHSPTARAVHVVSRSTIADLLRLLAGRSPTSVR